MLFLNIPIPLFLNIHEKVRYKKLATLDKNFKKVKEVEIVKL